MDNVINNENEIHIYTQIMQIYWLRHYYIPAKIRIQVRSSGNVFIGRDSHESRTGLVSLLIKRV